MSRQKQIIGFVEFGSGDEYFSSYNPQTQGNNPFEFYKASADEVHIAAKKAEQAFQLYRKKSGAERGAFLTAIAEGLLSTGDELISVCMSETALPAARIEGERVRTANQLKMFAALVSEGSWVDARIETSIPARAPIPKPDLRFMHIPLGPVVVFGASNFPLAFSVAGGDTASALAAGCTVIVKAHPAHPATSSLVGKIIQKAAETTNMPDGVFSLLFDNGISVGQQLVKHPLIKAVGFTGSFKAGKSIVDTAAARPVPIPVYAEMGSTNPVFILPRAMEQRGASIAEGYAGAVTLGVGQFCTNPGMLIYEKRTEAFDDSLKTAFEKTAGGVMLTAGIHDAFEDGVEKHLAVAGVARFTAPQVAADNLRIAKPVLLKTDRDVFLKHEQLSEEVFGPASLLVAVHDKDAMIEIAEHLSGHLTATVHGTDEDLDEHKDLLSILEQKVGRLIINGFPTGVEVCSAMVHGGPYPATSDGRSTSVGTAAIHRFTRPFCYQNMPQAMLPEALKNKNLLNITRLVNGERHKEDIS